MVDAREDGNVPGHATRTVYFRTSGAVAEVDSEIREEGHRTHVLGMLYTGMCLRVTLYQYYFYNNYYYYYILICGSNHLCSVFLWLW